MHIAVLHNTTFSDSMSPWELLLFHFAPKVNSREKKKTTILETFLKRCSIHKRVHKNSGVEHFPIEETMGKQWWIMNLCSEPNAPCDLTAKYMNKVFIKHLQNVMLHILSYRFALLKKQAPAAWLWFNQWFQHSLHAVHRDSYGERRPQQLS